MQYFVFGVFDGRVVVPSSGRIDDDAIPTADHFNGYVGDVLSDAGGIRDEGLREDEEGFHEDSWLREVRDLFRFLASSHLIVDPAVGDFEAIAQFGARFPAEDLLDEGIVAVATIDAFGRVEIVITL